MDVNYLAPLMAAFNAAANRERAVYMKKYLKDRFGFLGISTPEMRSIQKNFFRDNGLPAMDEMDGLVRFLWDLPEREYQHFAMEMMEKFVKRLPESFIHTYEFLLTNKSWWDTVDMIAARLVGVHFRRFPHLAKPYTQKWLHSGDIWLQRTVLIFQIKYRKETDLDLLASAINELSGSGEFFIRKAIGWSLREYSKTDPQWVVDFVDRASISNFSRKEALKRIRQ